MTAIKPLILFFLLIALLSGGCKNGKIPCPKIGGKKLSLFKKKEAPVDGKPETLGEKVNFDKKGYIKKSKYKYLRNKPYWKKYKGKQTLKEE